MCLVACVGCKGTRYEVDKVKEKGWPACWWMEVRCVDLQELIKFTPDGRRDVAHAPPALAAGVPRSIGRDSCAESGGTPIEPFQKPTMLISC